MPNIENLISNAERTPEQRQEFAKKAGIASGAARRRKKELRISLIAALEADDFKHQENICAALIKKAETGDVKAFEVIRDTIGEKADEKVILGYEDVLKEFLKNE